MSLLHVMAPPFGPTKLFSPLAVRSFTPFFSQHPCQHPIVILKDVPFRDLKVIIDFMYSGEVNIAQEFLPSFLQTAEALKIKGLSENESPANCSTPSKRSVQSEVNLPAESRCKRRRRSRTLPEDKSGGESIVGDVQEESRKENLPNDSNIVNCSPYDLSNSSTTNRYSSPMQRYEQAYNWGMSTESSKYCEVNLHDDDTNTTVRSTQDDSTTDPVGVDSDSPQDNKPQLSVVPGSMESLRQLQRVTGLMSTITTTTTSSSSKYSNSPSDDLDPSTAHMEEETTEAQSVLSESNVDSSPPMGLQLVQFLLNEDHLKHLRKTIPSSRPLTVHQRFDNPMFPISKDVIGRCTCIDPQKFVNDLLTELYSEEYLASHSITGQRWRNKDGTPKDGMNPMELDHIIRCVQTVFYSKQLSDAEVKSFIRIKLGNASKLYARRKQLANANLFRILQ